MSVDTIVTLCVLGVAIISGVAAIIVAIRRGEMKNFIIEKMEEAEQVYKELAKPMKSIKKLEYVIKAVKEKYKFAELIINISKFVEKVISISKQINSKED